MNDFVDSVGRDLRHLLRGLGWRPALHEAGSYEEAPSFVYWPALVAEMYGAPKLGTQAAAFVIRSERAGAASLMAEVRQAVWSVDRSVPVTSERTMQDVYAGSLARTAFVLVMLALRRLTCDGTLLTVVEDEQGSPLDVGRKQRTVSTALRRALYARDRGCSFPGCHRQRYLDAHHLHHWADGGDTSLE